MALFNPFAFRKYAALVTASMITTVFFFCGLIFTNNVWWALVCMALGMLLSVVLGSVVLLKNPWQDMLEGDGTMFLNIDSTGIMYQFLLGLKQNELDSGMSFFGKFGNKFVSDPFDREAALRMSEPIKIPNAITKKDDGGIHIDISAEELQKARLGMNTYTVILYNQMIGQIINKEFLAKQEKGAMIVHALNHIGQELKLHSFRIQDMMRGIIDTLMPSNSFKSNWIVWLIGGLLVVGAIFAAIKFFPLLKGALAPASNSASQAAQGASGSLPAAVTGHT